MRIQVIEDEPSAITPIMGLVFIAGASAVVAVYVGLLHFTGYSQFFFGLLFLFYWSTMQKADLGQILPSALGSLVGLTLGFLIQSEFTKTPILFIAICLAVFAIIYSFILGKLPTLTNPATILMLTVTTIPSATEGSSYLGAVISLTLAVIIFAGPLAIYKYRQT